MNTQSSTESEIIACEKRLYAAMLASDISTLQELIADDILFVGPSGEIMSKQMDLDSYSSGKMKVIELEPKEQEIRCFDNSAVAVTKIFVSVILEGNPVSANMRYTRVWNRTENGWRILAGHCSPIA